MGKVSRRTCSENKTGSGVRRRVKRLLLIAGAFCGFLAVLAGIAVYTLAYREPDVKRMCVDFNALVQEVETGDLSEAVGRADCALFDLDGRVVFSTIPQYRAGDSIDLHTLSGLTTVQYGGGTLTYVSPVVRDGRLSGQLLIAADKADYRTPDRRWLILLPFILLLGAGGFLILMKAQSELNDDLFSPLVMLHDATRRMLRGDLDTRLQYDYVGEIGSLCHDFDAMRDELAAAFRRERDLLNNDRLLLACISHDLKTPLAAISGYAEEIRDGIADDPAHVRELSERMLKKVKLQTKLIDDILEESKAQLGELSIVPEECYARAFFEDVCGELSLDAAKAGIEFSAEEIPDVMISIDRKRITQVVQNLISNSIKYTPRGGKIAIHFHTEGRGLVVGVQDNGRGIAAGDLPFIFDRFYRGDAARTQNIPGSGLGLCIAKNIVERHGGRIECDSVLGSGTEVCFSLSL